jgi:hypothetical protein
MGSVLFDACCSFDDTTDEQEASGRRRQPFSFFAGRFLVEAFLGRNDSAALTGLGIY